MTVGVNDGVPVEVGVVPEEVGEVTILMYPAVPISALLEASTPAEERKTRLDEQAVTDAGGTYCLAGCKKQADVQRSAMQRASVG